MNTWKLVSGVALVFIVGALVGSLGTRFYFKNHYRPFTLEPRDRTAFIMKRLSKDLGLSQSQKIAVEKIVAQTEEKLRDHFRQMRPEVKAIIDDSFSQIRKELDDGQKKQLDALREKFEKRRQARREGAFPKPPPKPE
jgi:nucleoid DNA-binding protein